MSDHTCDRKGPPAKVIDESGDEPITGIYPTCSVCGKPQVFTDEERFAEQACREMPRGVGAKARSRKRPTGSG